MQLDYCILKLYTVTNLIDPDASKYFAIEVLERIILDIMPC
jgi:hypothetical protein